MNPAWLAAGVHKDAATGTTRAAAVIRAGEMRHGWVLAVGGAQGLPGTAGVAVEQAALVAALEITRDLAVLAVEQQFASNALHDLVTGTAADMDQALQRAVRFGWDLQRPPAVLVARDCGDDAVHPQEGHPQEGARRRAARRRGTRRRGARRRGARRRPPRCAPSSCGPGRSGTGTGTPRSPGSPPNSWPWSASPTRPPWPARSTPT